MKKWLAVILAALLALGSALLVACGPAEEDPENPDNPDPPATTGTVTGVRLTCDDILFTGESVTLRATVETEGTVADTGVVWSVTGDGASITQDGTLTLTEEGNVTVTATAKADATKSASKDIQVLQGGAPINGTFDRAGDLMWGIYPPDPDNYEKTADVKRDGKYALKVTTTDDYTILFHAVTIGDGANEMKPGGFYVIEGYALSQTENCTVKPRVNFQNVISASEKPTLGAVEATQLTAANEWTRIASSTVRVPDDAVSFNACIELYGQGEIFLDSIRVIEVESNDTALSSLTVDGEAVAGYSDTLDSYTVQVDDVAAAVVAATARDSRTQVSVSKEGAAATVTVTAEDGTVRTITVNLIERQAASLASLSVGGTAFAEFNALRTEYYYQLPAGTAEVPEITYTLADSSASAQVNKPASLPGYATVAVTNGDDSMTYKIWFEAADANQLTMEYWNVGFESGLTGWGTDGADVTSETSHSGMSSLKAGADGKGAWLGFDFAGGTVAPSKGEAIKAGVWVYVEPQEEFADGYILIEFREKENDVLAAVVQYPVTAADTGKWFYAETPASSAITDAASYGQIVVKNFTGSAAYFDDVRVIRTTAAQPPEPVEKTEVDLSAFDPGFEVTVESTDRKFEPWAVDPAFDTTQKHGGEQSLKLDAPAYAGFKFVLNVGSEVQVGDVLEYSAWVYVESCDSNDDVMVKIETEDSYKVHKFLGGARGEWVQLTVTYTVTDADEQILLIVANDAAPAVFWVDDITLYKS